MADGKGERKSSSILNGAPVLGNARKTDQEAEKEKGRAERS